MTTYRYQPKDIDDWWVYDSDGDRLAVADTEADAILIVNALNLQSALQNTLKDLAGILKEMNR